MMMDFAGRLKRLRIEKGYSQAMLAKKSPMQAKSRAKHPSPNTRAEFPIVKDTTPNMMNPRLYTTSYNKPQGQQFDDTAVLSFIKLQYT